MGLWGLSLVAFSLLFARSECSADIERTLQDLLEFKQTAEKSLAAQSRQIHELQRRTAQLEVTVCILDPSFCDKISTNTDEEQEPEIPTTLAPALAVVKNATVRLTCKPNKDLPIPKIKWALNSVEIDVSSGHFSLHDNDCELRIHKINENDLGNYTCTAELPNGGMARQMFELVKKEFQIEHVKFNTTLIDDVVILRAQKDTWEGPIKSVSWYNAEGLQMFGTERQGQAMVINYNASRPEVSILKAQHEGLIVHVKVGNVLAEGNYSCVTVYESGKKIRQTFALPIGSLPSEPITISGLEESYMGGDLVEFECKVVGARPEAEVTLMLYGNPLAIEPEIEVDTTTRLATTSLKFKQPAGSTFNFMRGTQVFNCSGEIPSLGWSESVEQSTFLKRNPNGPRLPWE